MISQLISFLLIAAQLFYATDLNSEQASIPRETIEKNPHAEENIPYKPEGQKPITPEEIAQGRFEEQQAQHKWKPAIPTDPTFRQPTGEGEFKQFEPQAPEAPGEEQLSSRPVQKPEQPVPQQPRPTQAPPKREYNPTTERKIKELKPQIDQNQQEFQKLIRELSNRKNREQLTKEDFEKIRIEFDSFVDNYTALLRLQDPRFESFKTFHNVDWQTLSAETKNTIVSFADFLNQANDAAQHNIAGLDLAINNFNGLESWLNDQKKTNEELNRPENFDEKLSLYRTIEILKPDKSITQDIFNILKAKVTELKKQNVSSDELENYQGELVQQGQDLLKNFPDELYKAERKSIAQTISDNTRSLIENMQQLIKKSQEATQQLKNALLTLIGQTSVIDGGFGLVEQAVKLMSNENVLEALKVTAGQDPQVAQLSINILAVLPEAQELIISEGFTAQEFNDRMLTLLDNILKKEPGEKQPLSPYEAAQARFEAIPAPTEYIPESNLPKTERLKFLKGKVANLKESEITIAKTAFNPDPDDVSSALKIFEKQTVASEVASQKKTFLSPKEVSVQRLQLAELNKNIASNYESSIETLFNERDELLSQPNPDTNILFLRTEGIKTALGQMLLCLEDAQKQYKDAGRTQDAATMDKKIKAIKNNPKYRSIIPEISSEQFQKRLENIRKGKFDTLNYFTTQQLNDALTTLGGSSKFRKVLATGIVAEQGSVRLSAGFSILFLAAIITPCVVLILNQQQ